MLIIFHHIINSIQAYASYLLFPSLSFVVWFDLGFQVKKLLEKEKFYLYYWHYEVTKRRSSCMPLRKSILEGRYWCKGKWFTKRLTIWNMANHVLKPISWKEGQLLSKAHFNISVNSEVFIRRERGSKTKGSREGIEKFSMCIWAQSILIRQVMVQCVSS